MLYHIESKSTHTKITIIALLHRHTQTHTGLTRNILLRMSSTRRIIDQIEQSQRLRHQLVNGRLVIVVVQRRDRYLLLLLRKYKARAMVKICQFISSPHK